MMPLAADQWYGLIGIAVAVAGLVRLVTVQDLVARLVSLNVMGVGSLLLIMAVASRGAEVDPLLSALVITGLVITVAFTGLGAVLIRRLEGPDGGAEEDELP
ncbi:NADH-quinone oxidoreductase subunit K [Nesterenkonia sp. PF2B19]|uniref:NADH-quinone oxidoreductase subunit K n=1 Tax=unclassified Nesterenkonia TaxID=2629769 RepID=UPI0008723614|nr:NADH-quinone oxidoreductase subunit K [Nesterenkonia sp. PF2B19]OSM42781.1 hypothetical protein BCY76_012340 [Nesterenkonia sp. PF2B19]